MPDGENRFTRLDIQHGLSQSTVTAMAQTSDGAIWLGTHNGLNRYDGFTVKVFRPDNSRRHALSDNYITTLLPDAAGNLWIGTLSGLSRYNLHSGVIENLTFGVQDKNTAIFILSMQFDDSGRLWLGTEQGLAYYDAAQMKVVYLANQAIKAPLSITALALDADDLLLGTPQGLYRYNLRQKIMQKDSTFPLPAASVLSLFNAGDGQIWAGLDQHGVYHYAAGRWQAIEVNTQNLNTALREVRAITRDKRNNAIWIGSQQGLHLLHQYKDNWQQQAFYRHHPFSPNGLGSGKIASLLVDRDGAVWAGTWNSGVSRLHPDNNLFTSLTATNARMTQLRNPAAISLLGDKAQLWIGGAEGLYLLTPQLDTVQPVSAAADGRTYYCNSQDNNFIWFGHSSGISRLELNTMQLTEHELPDTLPKGPVRRLWLDHNRLWVVIDQFGLVLLDTEKWQVLQVHPMSRSVTFIRPFSTTKMLLGSYAGLHWFNRIDGNLLFEQALGSDVSETSQLLPAAPMDYRQDSKGRHWLATNGQGLYQMLPGDTDVSDAKTVRFRPVLSAQQGTIRDLKALETDATGNLWFSSASGISVYQPETNSYRHFTARHGTLTRDYINAASTTFADGTLGFGGIDGFTLFSPDKVLAYQAKPVAQPYIKTILTHSERGGQATALQQEQLNQVLQQGRLILSPQAQRNVSLEFATHEFANTANVNFEYRLDPTDSGWLQRQSDERSLTFERLPPGEYVLRLRARLPDTDWSSEYQLQILVLPRWWETTLARVLFALMLGSLLLLVHFYRLQRLQKQQQKLGLLVKERTEALENEKNRAELALEQLESTLSELVRTEKLAALGQLVAGVAHEVNTPLGVALTASSIISEESQQLQQAVSEQRISKAQLNDYLSKLAQASRLLDTNLQRAAQLITNFKQVSVDRTADNRRSVNLNHYLNELMESLSLLWKNRNILLTIECPESLTIDSYPGSIGQVITNLTQNAMLHGFKQKPSGSIRIRCKKNETGIELRFADNGQGIEESVLEQIFDPFFTTSRNQGGTGLGLHIVHNLVTQKLCGAIRVNSTPGKGTEFIINLPLSVTDSADGTAGY